MALLVDRDAHTEAENDNGDARAELDTRTTSPDGSGTSG